MTVTRGDLGRMDRTRRTAATWVRKAAASITWCAERATNAEQRWLIGYEAEQLLCTALDEFEALVSLLDADQVAEVEERLKRFDAKLGRQRRLFKLQNVEGRSPEEAALFRAKAVELGAHG